MSDSVASNLGDAGSVSEASSAFAKRPREEGVEINIQYKLDLG